MKTEAERHNNPDSFAMYGKLRRQLAKKEKELPELKRQAERSRSLLPPMSMIKEASRESREADPTEECELFFEEAKNFDDPPLVPDQMIKPKINISKNAM